MPRKSSGRTHKRSLSGTHWAKVDDKKVTVRTPAEFVREFGGQTPIEKILIANNGIAAVKCIRSIRRWSYNTFGNEKAIQFVVMVTPEDMAANAEFVKLADQHVDVPGGTNNHNYANVELIVELAKQQQVQAVWAGWGHASENPKLPEMLHAAGIIFMGPPAHAMRSLGDKISSSIVAQSANVPTLPWSGSDLSIECKPPVDGTPLQVPEDVYMKGCIHDLEGGLAAARKIGYPVMIKASEGGGGKGIRKATSEEEFPALYRQVLAEVPGSPVFIMKLASSARHLEVQVLADMHGNCIALFGRDCSVQRRHQKIIEEAPASIAPPEIFQEMEAAAIRLSKMVGYVSTGTIEYLYDVSTQTFSFLELNPRLQVEHPCSEMICGVNLPACQLMVAMGVPLHRIPDIRSMYSHDKYGDGDIELDDLSSRPPPNGHVIACRITAENPDEGFKPSGGTVQELNFRSSVDVWGYFSVGAAGGLHEFADSQFGHCFAWGRTRDDARHAMAVALKELSIRADFRTTAEYLVKLLEHDEFRNNAISTEWLDSLIVQRVKAERPDPMVAVTCGAVFIADADIAATETDFLAGMERGQIMSGEMLRKQRDIELIYDNVKYKLTIVGVGPTTYAVILNNTFIEADVRRLVDGSSLIRFNGESYVTYVKEDVTNYRIVVGGQTCIFDKEDDPSIVRTTSTGKLLKYLVADGTAVQAGDAIAQVEVMKMVSEVKVEASGRIQLAMVSGHNFGAGEVLATLELEDDTQVKKPVDYTDGFPSPSSATSVPQGKPHHALRAIVQQLSAIMKGYAFPEPYFHQRLHALVDRLFEVCTNRRLPLLEMRDLLATLAGRIPAEIVQGIQQQLGFYEKSLSSMICRFPAQKIDSIIYDHLESVNNKADQDALFQSCQDIFLKTKAFSAGERAHMMQIIGDLLREYVDLELVFSRSHSMESAVQALQSKHEGNPAAVAELLFAHSQLKVRNVLVKVLLEQVYKKRLCTKEQSDMMTLLKDLASLGASVHSSVALAARKILMKLHLPSYELRKNNMETIFVEAMEDSFSGTYSPERLERIVNSQTAVFDVLSGFFYHSSETIQQAALEVYVRRSYVAYTLTDITHRRSPSGCVVIQFAFHIPTKSAQDPEGLSREVHHQDHGGRSRTSSSGSIKVFDFESPCQTPPRTRSPTALLQSPTSSLSDDLSAALKSVVSIDDLQEFERQAEALTIDSVVMRMGVMAAFTSVEELEGQLPWLLTLFENSQHDAEPINILNIVLRIESEQDFEDDEVLLEMLSKFAHKYSDDFFPVQIRRVTFIMCRQGRFPKYFTFRERLAYKEDSIVRHVDPALAFKLEMFKLNNYKVEHCPTRNPQLHLYYAKAKDPKSAHDRRFFARTIMRHPDLVDKQATKAFMQEAGERLLLEALDELEVVFSDPKYAGTDCNHVFINFLPVVEVDPLAFAKELEAMIRRYGERLWRLRVLEAEVRMNIKLGKTGSTRVIRYVISNLSGYSLDIHIYKEIVMSSTGAAYYRALPGTPSGPLNGHHTHTPYACKDRTQQRRYMAQQKNETTYVYDYIDLFRVALEQRWQAYQKSNPSVHVPSKPLTAFELVLNKSGQLVEEQRAPGNNNVGMVAWRVEMKTPEYPTGRTMILIANDISYVSGSFSPKEDLVFLRASQLARSLGVPRIYIAVNSGARIGLAKEVLDRFKVAWKDEANPSHGFRYIYLTEEDYEWASDKQAVRAVLVEENGEKRYKITDVFGIQHGLGVENLRGSGEIASETSLSYDSNFTLTLVSCRSVGIGAYLVRLGQRTIQNEQSHIILTGHNAINKLLGSDVYASSLQLGGPQIMYSNGVSHLTATNDFESVRSVLSWLSYVPVTVDAPLPRFRWTIDARNSVCRPDPVDRLVTFVPDGHSDPRWLIEGVAGEQIAGEQEWKHGLFDHGSFVEMLGGWAKTVVTGRAKLGGIPVGVIGVSTSPVEVMIPADPANRESIAVVQQQAGQVWYPDSAYKTAQAIRDMNGEQLPLFILANWRGFSGGMRDMYDEVLKFGAMIVDNLRVYKQPVFVYLPPSGELRGGAWVVVDPTINPEMMEMYADPNSRGGVLEPEGIVSIKFKEKTMREAMLRLDDEYHRLHARANDTSLPAADREEATKLMDARFKSLRNVYHQVAVQFADLHDTPGRMRHKNCIRAVVEWAHARKYFYWRLRRRLAETMVRRELIKANETLTRQQTEFIMRRWFFDVHGPDKAHLWDSDETVANWFDASCDTDGNIAPDSQIARNLKMVAEEHKSEKLRAMAEDVGGDAALSGIMTLLEKLTPTQRAQLAQTLGGNGNKADAQ
ncbi:acetyl-CoA carboxylase [Salpingoeca rosetta]|uniref:Acetyl-CoA carboxylase n=1 Tax=Salpingoeca rosetta (strain ATCC 50818 / BSB-021) TaxID=946362 RepID=F2U425_SALR5|nr:acetyl-CoA carboxylase [Salpingoeca rosetta]EGD82369.1 acetyl-CoA carboxylase [Salpingoeca rosetta]|eukprot:XP_004996552.1 acetyl-CoA carboxylase [Salpingoeca rosetta]